MTQDICTSYVGQLFHGEARSRSWNPLIPGQINLKLGRREDGSWWMTANKKDMTWEKTIDLSFKYRIKDTFIQWQCHDDGGEVQSYGLRVKSEATAKQFGEAIDEILKLLREKGASSASSPVHARRGAKTTPPPQPSSHAPPPPTSNSGTAEKHNTGEESVLLKVQIPGGDETALKVPKSVPLQRILNSVCQRKQLDKAAFTVAQPPNSAHGQPLLCQPDMTVGDLKSYEIHLIRKDSAQQMPHPPQQGAGVAQGGKPRSESVNSDTEQQMLLQVELPQGQHTVVRVLPSILMGQLLAYICGKRNIDPAHHRFDLPVTEESLAQRSLQQLKINSIKVITKASAPPPTTTESVPPSSATPPSATTPTSPSKSRHNKKSTIKKKKSEEQDPGGSPLHGGRRTAPPPLPPERRKTQPELMRELTADLAERRSRGDSIGKREELGEGSEGSGSIGSSDDPPPQPTNPPTSMGSPMKTRGTLRPRTRPAPMPPPSSSTLPPPVDDVTTKGRSHSHPPPPPVANKRGSGESAPPLSNGCEGERERTSSNPSQARTEMLSQEGAITSALREQAEASKFGKFSSVRARKTDDQSPDHVTRHPQGRGKPPAPPDEKTRRPLSNPTVHDIAPTTADFNTMSRKPKKPAPPPPKRAATLSRLPRYETTPTESAEGKEGVESRSGLKAPPPTAKGRSVSEVAPPGSSTAPRGRPPRKAPSRPPPSAPGQSPVHKPLDTVSDTKKSVDGIKVAPPILEEEGETEIEVPAPKITSPQGFQRKDKVEIELCVKPPTPLLAEESASKPVSGKRLERREISPPPPPPPSQTQPPSTPPTSLPLETLPSGSPSRKHRSISSESPKADVSPKDRGVSSFDSPPRNAATTICKETGDGGKMLIVKPSPGSKRRAAGGPLVFKLPPPPPSAPPAAAPAVGEATPTSKAPKEKQKSVSPEPETNEEGKKKVKAKKKKPPKISEKPKKKKPRAKTPPKDTPTEEHKREELTEEEKPLPQDTPTTTAARDYVETASRQSAALSESMSELESMSCSISPDLLNSTMGSVSTTPSGGGVTPSRKLVSPGGGLLNATIVSNEFTNLDELLSNSSEDIVTTDFSIEENLEPPQPPRDLSGNHGNAGSHDNGGGSRGVGSGTVMRRLGSAGLSNNSMSDDSSENSPGEGGLFRIPSDEEERKFILKKRGSPRARRFGNNKVATPTKGPSNQSSPSRSPGQRRQPPPPPTEVMNSVVLLLNRNGNNNNNNNNNSVEGTVETSNFVEKNPTTSPKKARHVVEGSYTFPQADMPQELESDEDSSDTSTFSQGEDSGGVAVGVAGTEEEIVLLKVVKHQEDFEEIPPPPPPLPPQDEQVEEEEEVVAVSDTAGGTTERVQEGWGAGTDEEEKKGKEKADVEDKTDIEVKETAGDGYRMGDVTLNDLDNMVENLREFVQQSSSDPEDPAPLKELDGVVEDLLEQCSSLTEFTEPQGTTILPYPLPPPPPPLSGTPPPAPPTSDLPSDLPPSPPSSPPPPLSLHATLEDEGRDLATPPPPPPPSSAPPPLSTIAGELPDEVEGQDDENALPPPPKLTTKARSKFSVSRPAVPPAPPPTKPKGLFRRKKSIDATKTDNEPSSAKNELFEKMRERQAKLKAEKAESTGDSSNISSQPSEKDEQPVSQDTAAPPTLTAPAATSATAATAAAAGTGGGDNMQMQLQFLQQQMMQQQMMQLQQQFQQLLAMNPGINLPQGMGMMPNMGMPGGMPPNMGAAGMPSMGAAGMGVPASSGMSVAGMGAPNMGMGMPPNMGMGTAGMGAPNMGMGAGGMGMSTMQQNQTGFSGAAQFSNPQLSNVGPQMGGVPNPMMMSPQMMGMGISSGLPPQGGMSAQLPPQQVTTTAGQFVPQQVTTTGQAVGPLPGSQLSSGQYSSSQDSQNSSGQQPSYQDIATESPADIAPTPTGRKKSKSMVQRSESMGAMEPRFDALMDDIRETNPHSILKPAPEVDEDSEPDVSSYTEMATAIANAIKDRRHHISDKRQSLDEESYMEEWQSP